MPDESLPTPLRRSDEARPPGIVRPSSDARSSSDPGTSECDRPSRRSFLASAGTATAGLAATAGLGATAGCVELLPTMGQEVRYESVAVPEASPPRYREWIPVRDIDNWDDMVPDVVAIPNNDSEAVTGVPLNYGRGFLAGALDYFGVGFGNYDLAFHIRGHPNDVFVLEGPIAPDEVGPTLLETRYEADGRRWGADRYVREDLPRTVAVWDGRILFGKGPERDAAIQRALDAHAEEGSLAAENPGFVRVTDRAGLRPFLIMGTSFSGLVDEYPLDWSTVGIDFDEDGFYFCYYLLFADERPSRDEFEDEIESMEVGENADAVEIERDGQLAAIEILVSPGTLESEYATANRMVPQATWGVEDDSETIVVRHEAGDAIPAEYLTLRDGWMNDPALPTQFSDEYTTVGPGASVRVDRDEIREGPLSVMWEDSNSSIVLLEYRP